MRGQRPARLRAAAAGRAVGQRRSQHWRLAGVALYRVLEWAGVPASAVEILFEHVATRLWLGGVVGAYRDRTLLATLTAQIVRCAACAPLLLVVDGLSTYVGVFLAAFRQRVLDRRGRPCRVMWPHLVIGQVVKQYTAAGRGAAGA